MNLSVCVTQHFELFQRKVLFILFVGINLPLYMQGGRHADHVTKHIRVPLQALIKSWICVMYILPCVAKHKLKGLAQQKLAFVHFVDLNICSSLLYFSLGCEKLFP